MESKLVDAAAVSLPAIIVGQSELPAMVERAGAAGRLAWDEYCYAEHHNPHTQAAYMRAVGFDAKPV